MLALAILLLALLILGSILGLMFPIRGTWERMTDSNQSIWNRERMVLKQFGMIVVGHQTVPGGAQKFFGFAFGPSVWLKRRDYGINALKQEGFPEPIAKLVQGKVLLYLNLKLSPDRLFLTGHATPMKVEYFEDGSGVKNIHPVEPITRSYRRSELTPVSKEKLAPLARPAY